MIIQFIEIDNNGYFLCDAPGASEPTATAAPHAAQDGTTPDGMRKPRWTGTWDGEIWNGGSWVDDEAASLAADLAAQQVKHVEAAIDALVLSKARERYNSVESCVTYINSTNPQWAAEAQAFIAYRDAVWVYVVAEMSKVQAGNRAMPTPAEAVAEVEANVGGVAWPL